jgi:hypothetical protein
MMLIMILGAFPIFLPVVALFVTAAIVAGLLRVYFQRPPSGQNTAKPRMSQIKF